VTEVDRDRFPDMVLSWDEDDEIIDEEETWAGEGAIEP
jgi:hypothetical protein